MTGRDSGERSSFFEPTITSSPAAGVPDWTSAVSPLDRDGF
jgi:hypothetical protein